MASLTETLFRDLSSLCRVALSVICTSLFVGCTPHSSWQLQRVEGAFCVKNTVEDVYRGVQLEIIQVDGAIYGYLNLFCIPLDPANPCVDVLFSWSGKEVCKSLPVLKGGQRIALPFQWLQQLAEPLAAGQPVEVKVGRYCGTLPAGFPVAL